MMVAVKKGYFFWDVMNKFQLGVKYNAFSVLHHEDCLTKMGIHNHYIQMRIQGLWVHAKQQEKQIVLCNKKVEIYFCLLNLCHFFCWKLKIVFFNLWILRKMLSVLNFILITSSFIYVFDLLFQKLNFKIWKSWLPKFKFWNYKKLYSRS